MHISSPPNEPDQKKKERKSEKNFEKKNGTSKEVKKNMEGTRKVIEMLKRKRKKKE
jgi:hypothetical protein